MAHLGTVVVSSSFDATFDFGGGVVETPTGLVDGYAATFDSGGGLSGVATLGAVGARVIVEAIAMDSSENVVVAGTFSGTVDFGRGPETASGVASAFLLYSDSGGTRRWHQTFGSAGSDAVTAVAMTSSRVFIGGNIGAEVDLGGGMRVRPADGMPFDAAIVVAYGATDGAALWSRVLDQPDASVTGDARVADLAPEGDGVVVAGAFDGTVNFGGGAVRSTFDPVIGIDSTDVFVVWYGDMGIHQRDRALGGAGAQSARSIEVGPGGSTNLAGQFAGTIDFGSGTRVSTMGAWGFVARLPD